MTIINFLINESLIDAELALGKATSDNIVELCRNYLKLLTEYRDQLYDLRGMPEINIKQSSLGRELIEQARKAVRAAVEITVRERNETESLLESFTTINGHEAAETFNQLKYKGSDGWEMRAGGVRFKNGVDDKPMPVQEAVDLAGQLRRDAYVANKITFLRK
ncbi:MAG: hypothetical protein WA584_22275 [Pyrinomonadaceae bacterium]